MAHDDTVAGLGPGDHAARWHDGGSQEMTRTFDVRSGPQGADGQDEYAIVAAIGVAPAGDDGEEGRCAMALRVDMS